MKLKTSSHALRRSLGIMVISGVLLATMPVYAGSCWNLGGYRRQTKLMQQIEQQEKPQLAKVNYVPYPRITPGSLAHSTGGGTSGPTINFQFKSPDPAEKVLEFYAARARSAGMQIWSGCGRGMPDYRIMLAVNEAEKTALRASGITSVHMYGVVVYTAIPPDFIAYMRKGMDLQQQ